MRAQAELVASAALAGPSPVNGCRLTSVHDAPPFAFRATPQAVYIVGTAAAPVGDDQLSLRVEVKAGAHLTMRSAAATIAWASRGSSLSIDVEVGPGASLDWHLQPLVASAGCDFAQYARLSLADGARVRWVEEVVLGRHKEGPGQLVLRLDVDVQKKALLRHQLAVGPGAPGWDGPAVLGPNRAMGLVVTAGPVAAGPVAAGPVAAGAVAAGAVTASSGADNGARWAVMPLDGPGTLVQVVGPDLAAVREAFHILATPATHPRNTAWS